MKSGEIRRSTSDPMRCAAPKSTSDRSIGQPRRHCRSRSARSLAFAEVLTVRPWLRLSASQNSIGRGFDRFGLPVWPARLFGHCEVGPAYPRHCERRSLALEGETRQFARAPLESPPTVTRRGELRKQFVLACQDPSGVFPNLLSFFLRLQIDSILTKVRKNRNSQEQKPDSRCAIDQRGLVHQLIPTEQPSTSAARQFAVRTDRTTARINGIVKNILREPAFVGRTGVCAEQCRRIHIQQGRQHGLIPLRARIGGEWRQRKASSARASTSGSPGGRLL
jgi:hypothetical protein